MKKLDVSQLLDVCRDAGIVEAEEIVADLLESLEGLGFLVAKHLGISFVGIEQSPDGLMAGFCPCRVAGAGLSGLVAYGNECGEVERNRERTVLVCDDDRTQTLLAREAVTASGLRVIEAHSADEAWQAYQAGPVDMVVIDTTLPGFAGSELLRRIVAETGSHTRRRRKVPIITISADEWRDCNRCERDQVGSVIHLTKRIDWTRLGRMIGELCQVS